MNIQDYKTLGVLYPPFGGGNHLCNMLSTSPHIANRRPVDNYLELLLSIYSDSSAETAHLEDDISLSSVLDPELAKQQVSASPQTVLIPGHTENAVWVYPQLQSMGRIGLITLEIYDADSFYNMPRANQPENAYNPYLYRFMYRKEIVTRLMDVPEDDILAVDIKEFFQPDIRPLLTGISNMMQLDLDIDFCSNLHNLWYKKIIK